MLKAESKINEATCLVSESLDFGKQFRAEAKASDSFVGLLDRAFTVLKQTAKGGVAALAIASAPSSSDAAVVATSSNDLDRITAAQMYDGKVVSVNAAYPAGASWSAGSVSASGTVVNNQWILTSEHFVNQMLPFNATFSISTGSNFILNPVVTLSIDSYVVNPDPNIDLALMKVSGFIPNAIDAVFAAPVVGETNFHVSYGIKYDLSNNTQVYSGDRRLFTGIVSDKLVASASGPIFETEFYVNNPDPLAGKGWTWDSGGGVFDSLGRQTGSMQYQGGGPFYGVTGSQLLVDPAVQDWIHRTVPEPGSIMFLALGAGYFLVMRNRSSQKE